ncbi:MAG: flagellar hook-associated protein 3 [Treponema sp.]|jgi:flagellar hook-associated protein 3 FlgL|nr:flagellar hook-associated protein 3 [Treponema sp.]
MKRIATNMPVTDMQFHLRRHEDNMSNIQKKIGTGSRIQRLRDDPIGAAHAARYDSFITRLNRFETNTQVAMKHFDNTHDYLANEIMPITHRIRELAVNAANGTNTPDDLRIMALEVNELLKEMVSVSNALGPDTRQVFAGDKVFTQPFRIVEGTVQGGGETMITAVEYRGAGPSRKVEIGDNMFLDLDLGGGEAFWAERMQIYSTTDATDYRVQEPGAFFIDGVEINVSVGDTLPAIVAKINDSPAPVKAYIDPTSRGLVLEGTNAHLIRAEDRVGGATVLRDLGIIAGNMENNAPNWSADARVYGGSIFDMVIRLRDGMLRGDHEFIGSQGIAGMELVVNNVAYRMADVSSRKERAEFAWMRITQQIPNVTDMLGRETGIDLAQTITEMKMSQVAQQAALQAAAKILPMSLLDFLR